MSFFVVLSFVSALDTLGLLAVVLGFLGFAMYLIIGVGCCFSCYVSLTDRSFKAALSYLATPVFVCLCIARPAIFLQLAQSPDYLHLAVHYRHYANAVDRVSAQDTPKIMWFFWRDASTIFDASYQYLAFDEADQLALSGADRTPLWEDRAEAAWLRDGHMGWSPIKIPGNARHLVGHWYVVFLDE